MIVKLASGASASAVLPGLRPILPRPPLQSQSKVDGTGTPSIKAMSQSGGGTLQASFTSVKMPEQSREASKPASSARESSVNLRKRKSPPSSSYDTRGSPKRTEPTSKVSSMRSMASPTKDAPVASTSNPRAEALDFSQIRTSAPRVMPPRSRNRLYNLEHCPVFYPNEDEFARPLEYIERIAVACRTLDYGICKIVPPTGWQPPFALDTEVCVCSRTGHRHH